MSVFDKPGLYLRAPDGGVEGLVEMRDAGFQSVAVNVADYQINAWDEVLNRAERAGVTVLPWGRTRNDAAVARLCAIARAMDAKAVLVNAETELFDGTLDLKVIANETQGLDACLSTLAWSGDVLWHPVARLRLHLQMFPQETDTAKHPRDCRVKAFANGAKRVNFMLGIHDITPKELPPRQGGYWVYTGDDTGNNYAPWSPQRPPSLAIPFQGPLYPVGHKLYVKGKRPWTIRALKVACHRSGFGDFYQETPDPTYGPRLKEAIANLQRTLGVRATGLYGSGTHVLLMTLLAAQPESGYALDERAQAWMRVA
jgi:hypothetical protein